MSRIAWFALIALAVLLAACQSAAPTIEPLVVPLTPLPTGCSDPIAVYLTAQPMNGAAVLKTDIAAVPLQAQPVIAAQDIVSYDRQQGGLVLSEVALQRLTALKVPTDGRGFVVCASGKRLAVGAFWTPLSSASFEGMVIMAPFGPDEKTAVWTQAYPGGSGNPLDNPAVLDALAQAGKLR